MKEKTVFITGAAGFIGRNVARYFSENGWYVAGIGLGEWSEEEFKNWGIDEWHPGLITKELLLNIKNKPDLIIHCAGGGSVGFSVENPEEDFNLTVESTRSVLEYMRGSCPDARMIYPSSAAVYGQKEDAPIKEEDNLEPVSPYGLHKKTAEDLCRQYSDKYNINISIVRLFSVYGEGLQKQLLWDACQKMSKAKKDIVFFGTGDETRDWIHIDDAARLFLAVSESKNNFEIINGASGERTKIQEILEILSKEYGKNSGIVFNGISKNGDPKYYWANIDKAIALGWKPQMKLEKGVSEYVNYFKKIK